MPTYNATYDFAIDRFNAIFHIRLNLDTCALNYYLKIGCRESPVRFCGLHNATVKYFFLNVHFILPLELIFFPLFFLSIFADRWSSMSKAQIISVSFCLDHHYCLRSKIMADLFLHLQSFISESLRFYKSNLTCIFVLQAFL